jgi:hypothetical protein
MNIHRKRKESKKETYTDEGVQKRTIFYLEGKIESKCGTKL